MNVFEAGMWVFRMMIIALVSVVLVFIMGVSSPRVDAMDVRADVIAARVAYNGGFTTEPGVISEELFLQGAGDQYLRYEGETVTKVAVVAWVKEPRRGDPLLGGAERTYNSHVYRLLDPLRGLKGVEEEIIELPATLEDTRGRRRPAVLVLEVLYET